MDDTRQLADFCQKIAYEDLPPEVIHQAKLCILDYVSNVYGSLELQAVAGVAAYIKSLGGAPKATAHGCGFKTDVHHAAFINGTTAEAIESQDGYRFGGNHAGVTVIPAVLAVAEEMGKNGEEIIEAVVAGYEVANRTSAAGHPQQSLSGFLPTGSCGAFGAAAAVARLIGLSQDAFLNTIGNAGYLSPISMGGQLRGGFTIKIVQGGQGACAGIMAAGLAARGITGMPFVLEGSELTAGFVQMTTGGQARLEKLTEALGEYYTITDIYFKPFTACRHTHGAIQAMLQLLKEEPIDTEEIDKIEVFTYGMAQRAVGKGMQEQGSFVSAQFSIPYMVAACLFDHKLGPRQLTEERLSDPGILALSSKVKVNMDEELNAVYPDKTSSRVEITLSSGDRKVCQIDIPPGDPRKPLEAGELSGKLRLFAGQRDTARVERVINMIMGLENLKNVSELAELI